MKKKLGILILCLVASHVLWMDSPPSLSCLCKDKPVIVIGAGFAGLGAAHKLSKMGWEVVLLEAQDRQGGRVKQDENNLEIGAAWVHGRTQDEKKGNILLELAKELGIPLQYVGGSSTYVSEKADLDLKSAGTDWATVQDVESSYVLMYELFEFMRHRRDYLLKTSAPDQSIGDVFTEYIKLKQLGDFEKELLLWHLEVHFGTDDGMDPFEESLVYYEAWYSKFMTEEEQTRRHLGDYIVVGGFGEWIRSLSVGLDIRLNQRVTRVKHGKHGVSIETEQGETIEGGSALCTVPLGVLQRDTIEWIPPLPPDKDRAIHGLQMGVEDKLYLTFPYSFWDNDTEAYGVLWSREGYDYFPYIENYALSHDGEPILEFYFGGLRAKYLEKKSDAELTALAMKQLRRMFCDDEDDVVPEPIATLVTRWGLNEMSHGSFAAPIAFGYTEADVKAYQRPVDSRLFFAGDGVHIEHSGTIRAAYTTAMQAVDAINAASMSQQCRSGPCWG